jgi:phosphate transport system permease protein
MTTLPTSPSPARPSLAAGSPMKERLRRGIDRVMYTLCILAAFSIIGILLLVTGYLLSLGWSGLSVSVFTQITSGDPMAPGGLKNGLVGQVILIGMASLVGVPMGMLTGIYLSEFGSNSLLASPVRFIADVLAGVPSIVVGILGYELLVVPLGRNNAYAGAGALAFIMIPIIARTTEEMLRLVPNSYREASVALGASKTRTIFKVVLPAATGSVITGIMLAIARVAGETAPLLFTALGSRFMPILYTDGGVPMGLDLHNPFPSLTVQIYNFARGPYLSEQRLAWAGVIVLVSLIFVLNLAIRLIASRQMRKLHG